jgi:hypothetical protein
MHLFTFTAALFGASLAVPVPGPEDNAVIEKKDTIIDWTGTCNRFTNICTSSTSHLMYNCVS